MKLKNKAYEGLSLLFQCERVPPATICDNAKEMVLGEFNRKLMEASCHLKQTAPFTPWLNAAKREKNEMKKGSSKKLIKSGNQKRLWDDCLNLSSISHLILQMASTNWMGKFLKSLCLARRPTFSNFWVRMVGMSNVLRWNRGISEWSLQTG